MATWIAWEVAVNLALQLNESWLEAAGIPETIRMYVSGFAAGAVGAFLTWAGVAVCAPRLRHAVAAVHFLRQPCAYATSTPDRR